MPNSFRATTIRIDRRIAATTPKIVVGVIAALASNGRTATVTVDLGSLTATISSGATYTLGQTVRVLRTPIGSAILGGAGSPAFTPAPGLRTPRSGVQQFPALDSGTLGADNRWADTSALTADSSHQGFWFHGRAMLDSLPGAIPATSTPLQLWINPVQPGSFTLFLHGAFSRSNAAYLAGRTPRTTRTVAGPGWVDLPTAWAQTLLSAGGSIGIDSTGNARGLAEDGQSGAIRIAWTK